MLMKTLKSLMKIALQKLVKILVFSKCTPAKDELSRYKTKVAELERKLHEKSMELYSIRMKTAELSSPGNSSLSSQVFFRLPSQVCFKSMK